MRTLEIGDAMKRHARLLPFLLVALFVPHARAAGIAVNDQSAAALGVANAFTAAASDVSALHYNPAGIAWQSGSRLLAGGVLSYRNASAGGTANGGGLPTLWHVYGSWMPLEQDWGLGVSFTTPFAVQNDWGSAFNGKASRTDFIVYRAAVDAIYAPNSSMAFAVGADWYLARLTLNSGTSNFRGTDKAAFGAHVAWRWKPSHALAVGALVRSGSKLKLAGHATGTVSGPASVRVRLPDEVRIGVAYDLLDPLRLEVDGSWMRWSRWSDLDLRGVTQRESNPLKLRDAYAVMAGVTWTWREGAQLRFGYAFDRAANRVPGFNARIADANAHRFSLGAGGDVFGLHADLAYAYTRFTNRTVTGSAPFDAVFRESRHTFMLSLGSPF